jgi:hypothetical protein
VPKPSDIRMTHVMSRNERIEIRKVGPYMEGTNYQASLFRNGQLVLSVKDMSPEFAVLSLLERVGYAETE